MAFDACGMTNEQRYSDADRARIRAGFAWIGEHDPDVKLGRLARLASQELTLWAVLRTVCNASGNECIRMDIGAQCPPSAGRLTADRRVRAGQPFAVPVGRTRRRQWRRRRGDDRPSPEDPCAAPTRID